MSPRTNAAIILTTLLALAASLLAVPTVATAAGPYDCTGSSEAGHPGEEITLVLSCATTDVLDPSWLVLFPGDELEFVSLTGSNPFALTYRIADDAQTSFTAYIIPLVVPGPGGSSTNIVTHYSIDARIPVELGGQLELNGAGRSCGQAYGRPCVIAAPEPATSRTTSRSLSRKRRRTIGVGMRVKPRARNVHTGRLTAREQVASTMLLQRKTRRGWRNVRKLERKPRLGVRSRLPIGRFRLNRGRYRVMSVTRKTDRVRSTVTYRHFVVR